MQQHDAGLTVKYFPVWLYDSVKMSPVGLSFVQASMPVCCAAASLGATYLAASAGDPPPPPFPHLNCQLWPMTCC